MMFYALATGFGAALLALVFPIGMVLCRLSSGRESPGGEAETALAPVVGLAAMISLVSLALHLGAPASVLVPGAVVANLAAVGGWLALRRRPARRARAGRQGLSGARRCAMPLFISFVSYLVLIAPLLLAGRPGVLAYRVNHDAVFHSIMPEYLEANGYNFSRSARDGFAEAAYDKFVNQGYPDGWHQILLLAKRLFQRRAYLLFNFTEAFFLSLLAPVAYLWLRLIGVGRGWSLLGGLTATTGFIQLSYLFQGFAPQVAVTPFIYACMLLFFDILEYGRWRYLPLAALLLQASVAVYSFTIILWLGVFILAILIYRLWITRSLLGIKVELGAVGAAVGLAALLNPFSLLGVTAAYRMVTVWSAMGIMGNLLSRRVPILPALGVWLAGDHRLVPNRLLLHGLSYAGAFLVAGLLIYGLGSRLLKRRVLLSLTAAVAVPVVWLKITAGPYYFAKTLQLAAPAIAIAAAAGLWRLSRAENRRRRAFVLAGLYLMGLAASDWVAIRSATPWPQDRLAELEAINARFAPTAPALFIDTGEDWGKYLLGDLKTVSPFAVSYQGRGPGTRDILAPAAINDLDTLKGVISRGFALIVIAKGQDISLAPPPYELVFSGRFYNVYARPDRRDGRDIIGHLPFETMPVARKMPYREVRPGQTVGLRLKRPFKSLLVAAYLFPGDDSPPSGVELSASALAEFNRRRIAGLAEQPGQEVLFTVDGKSQTAKIRQVPAVYGLALPGDSGAMLRVRNITPHPLRLDWIELLKRPHDRAALFRYNYKNKEAWQSIERLLSR